MKTILPRQLFQEALTAVATLAGGRTTRPVLSCVKLVAHDDVIELMGTDGEATLHLSVPPLSLEREGAAVIPADRLLSIVRSLPDVELKLETAESTCTIRGEGSEFKIYTMSVEDFPPTPEFDGDPDLTIDGALLRRMIGMTIYAAARETSRYAINGVLWEKRGDHLFAVATDGRRLARAGAALRDSDSADFEVIVPAKALGVFEKVFTHPSANDWVVEVKVAPNQVMLRGGGRLLSTVLVEGHFPQYDKVIPANNTRTAKVDRDLLAAAVKRAALLTTEESRAVRLSFGGSGLVITSQSPEQGEARVEVPLDFDGDPMEIGFNPAFLGDALKAMDYETVQLELEDHNLPGVLYGESKDEFLYVLMPVSLGT